METSLLTTKLLVPPARPGLVARPRLTERFQAVLSCSLVLVSAPAGYGKTTLVSDWAGQFKKQCPTAWLSLDEGDNDPVRFWDYFIASLRTLKTDAGETSLILLHSPEPYPTEAVLTALINDLSGIPHDFAVVLDDYHLIKAEAIQLGITFLLEHLPPKMHVVIATRTDPPLGLAHFRGHGTILEIGTDDLRFTVTETAGLLREMINVNLSAEDISALNARTEGWVVGLKMAALSIGKQTDIPGFIATFTGSQRYVMDYLIEEVMRQQSPQVQDFLLKTSVLERLTAPLCDFVTGHIGGREMLVNLEQSNLFLIPMDESRHWYRYHHLFAELLRHQLEVKSGLEEVAALRQRASQWYEDNGFSDDAIQHALEARDWERAVRLIYDPDEKRIKRAEWNTLLNWLQVIPDEVLRTHRQLYRQFAQVLINPAGDLEAAEAILGYLGQAEHDNNFLGEIATLEASIASSRREYQRTVELSRKALSLLAPENLRARSAAAYTLGQIIWSKGLFEEAEPILTEAFNSARQSGYLQIAGNAVNFLANIKWHRGQMRQAVEMLEQAIRLAEKSPAFSAPMVSLSSFYYEWNDLNKAAYYQQRVIDLVQLGGTLLAQGYFFLAHTRLAMGDIAGANTAMEKADQLVLNPGVAQSNLARHAAYRFMFAIRQDESAAILHWGNKVLEYADSMPPFLWHIQHRVLIARGENTIAAQQLAALYEKTIQAGMEGTSVRVIICQALASATPAEALTFLAKALTKAQPEGHVRTFVDEGKLLAPLLRKALAQGITPEYTSKLLNIIQSEERNRKIQNGEVIPLSSGSGVLSQRELEILQLLASGLSNRQISEGLIISLGTVKRHVHNIFEKLNAKTRTQAAARGRELKLL